MDSFKKYLPIALLLGFLLFGLDAFMQSKPSNKNARVYKTVQQYSPYYLDKRFGGLQIMHKHDPEFKEKPNNMTLFKEFERLEKEWAKTHMKRKSNTVTILDDNGSKIAEFSLQNKEELNFVKNYYGL
jgi:branched-subunit amino acid aminotransferase/4-amino-4-deoxychorismate lyase